MLRTKPPQKNTAKDLAEKNDAVLKRMSGRYPLCKIPGCSVKFRRGECSEEDVRDCFRTLSKM